MSDLPPGEREPAPSSERELLRALQAIAEIDDPAGDASKYGFTGLATAKRLAREALASATQEPALDLHTQPLRVDWNKPDLAEAYDLIEGVRRRAAQDPESGIDASLRAALDAVEAADCEWDGLPPNEDDFTYIEDLRDAEDAYRAVRAGGEQ